MKRLESSYTADREVNGTTTVETVWQFLKWLNLRLPYDLAIPLLGKYPNKMKIYVPIKTCNQMLIAALFIIAKKWKQPPNTPTDEWISK